MEKQQIETIYSGSRKNGLSLIRYLGNDQKSVIVKCQPGTITILADEGGMTLRYYLNSFSPKKDVKQTVMLQYDGQIEARNSVAMVGFEEELPDLSIPQYLLSNGIDENKIEELIDEFELRGQLFLQCSQLSRTEARQIQLLVAVGRQSPIMILNDPFQPFSGRWREAFGEYIMNDCLENNRIIICTNISFIPNSWLSKNNVGSYDVGALAEKILQKEKEVSKAAAKEVQKRQNVNELNEKYYRAPIKISIPISESFVFVANSVQERVFNTLSQVGTFLREWSGAVFFVTIAVIAVLAGVILSYDVGGSRAKLQMVINRIAQQKIEEAKNPQPQVVEEKVDLKEKPKTEKESPSKEEQTDKVKEADSSSESEMVDENESSLIPIDEANLSAEPELNEVTPVDVESLKITFILLGIPWGTQEVMTDGLMSVQKD
jgi:hypothetical protein